MKFKPFLIAAGGVLTTAGAVVLLPSSALAHHPVVSGTPVCTNAPSYDVTWTVSADAVRDLEWSVNGSAYQPDSQQFVFTTTESGDTASFTANGTWSNGQTGSATGTTNRPPECVETTTTTTMPEETTTTTTMPEEETTTTTTSPEEETTTTTTSPEEETTTTTAPEEETTTTAVSSGGPSTTTTTPAGGGSTTTTVPGGSGGSTTTSTTPAGGGSTTTTTTSGQLPETGGGPGSLPVVAAIVMLAGTALYFGGRRSPS